MPKSEHFTALRHGQPAAPAPAGSAPHLPLSDEAADKLASLAPQPCDPLLFLVTDVRGVPLGMTEMGRTLKGTSQHGFSVDGSSLAGCAGVSRSDVVICPEPDASYRLNFLPNTPNAVFSHLATADFQDHAPGCPRGALYRVLERFAARGLVPYTMSELEWYYTKHDSKTNAGQAGGYMRLYPDDPWATVRDRTAAALEAAGVPLRRAHSECGSGQSEIELLISPAMENCDHTVLAMWAIKSFAAEIGADADFGPAPVEGRAGSGLHNHFYVARINADGSHTNLFEPTDEERAAGNTVSEYARIFIGGILRRAREIQALFTASSTYKRLGAGETPASITAAAADRKALIRIPHPGSRAEIRSLDCTRSVHLANALFLAAGLEAIESGAAPVDLLTPDPSPATLPSNRKEAVAILLESTWAHEILGENTIRWLVANDN